MFELMDPTDYEVEEVKTTIYRDCDIREMENGLFRVYRYRQNGAEVYLDSVLDMTAAKELVDMVMDDLLL